MAPEIRFNSLGIPYLVEFANVHFRSRSHPSHSFPRPTSSWVSINHSLGVYGSTSTLLGSLATASSETLICPEESSSDGEGLFIQFASHRFRPPHKLSGSRLMRLKQRIAKAVLAAGMDSSPAAEKGDPMEVPNLSRISCGSIQSTDSGPVEDQGSLFRGTYGQVMTALQSVGLVTTPCKESGLDEATRLGALFVANHKENGGVEFTKLTLWA